MDWNPNDGCALGLEWFPSVEETLRLDSRNAAMGMLLHSTVAETIETVYLGTLGAFGDPQGEESGFELEIYDVADLPSPEATSRSTFVPVADAGNVRMYGWSSSLSPGISPPTQSNLYRFVDNVPSGVHTFPSGVSVGDDELIFPTFGRSAAMSFYVGGLAGALTSKQILRVELDITVGSYTDLDAVSNAAFTPFLNIDGVRYYGTTTTIKRSERAFRSSADAVWDANPATGCSWTVEDVEAFDVTNSDSRIGISIAATGSSNNLAACLYMAMRVTYQNTDDFRLALGCVDDPASVEVGWTPVTLVQPDGTPTWAKQDATDYLFVARRRDGRGNLDLRVLTDPTRRPPAGGWERAGVELFNATNRVYNYFDEPPLSGSGFNANGRVFGATALDGLFGVLLETDAPATSVDSQPYMSINGDGGKRARFEWTRVNSGQSMEQELTTPAGGDDYGHLRVLVRQETDEPDGPLEMRVRRRSDNVQIGSTVTIETGDLEPPRSGPRAWQIVGKDLDIAATLAGATQYYVEVTSTATLGTAWEVQVASALPAAWPSGAPPADVDNALFGGGADELTIVGGDTPGDYDTMTACVTLHTLDPAPTGFTVVEVADSTCLHHGQLLWTPIAVPDCGFQRYEIERWDDRTARWERIAEITNRLVSGMVDYECRRNVASTWRIRYRRTDDAPSAWASWSETIEMPCATGWVIASNAAPDLALYLDDCDDGQWDPVFLENTEYLQFEGRKMGVVFHELEDRGIQFDTTVLVYTVECSVDAVLDGIQAFDAVLDSIRPSRGATLPYLAVCSPLGDRWYAGILSPDGSRSGLPKRAHTMDLTVIQATDRPRPIDIVGPVASGSGTS